MEQSKTLEILKTGILLERRGKAFYANCAIQATNPEVKQLFETLAEEEDEHINFLTEQYIYYKHNHNFANSDLKSFIDIEENKNLIEKVTSNISAEGYEAAAIAAALDMEERAIKVYSEQAKNATDKEEKEFYEWLAEWERGHHRILFEIDKELKEKIWLNNDFWPF